MGREVVVTVLSSSRQKFSCLNMTRSVRFDVEMVSGRTALSEKDVISGQSGVVVWSIMSNCQEDFV